ncbi:phage portal protein, partial [Xenorhabdus sp. Flor]|nr:phage portal protein [Xenorhabdus sp. Flor]
MWPFTRKAPETRSMTLEEFLSLAGIANTKSGEHVSPSTAEGLPAVMNAVIVISEAVASMPCYLYRVAHQNGKE